MQNFFAVLFLVGVFLIVAVGLYNIEWVWLFNTLLSLSGNFLAFSVSKKVAVIAFVCIVVGYAGVLFSRKRIF